MASQSEYGRLPRVRMLCLSRWNLTSSRFARVLDEAQQLLQEQAGCSNLAQIFKQQRHADELRGMSERLTNSFNVLLVSNCHAV